MYNVGCGGHSSYRYQLIQALTLDFSWSKHGQPGRLTRIVSGCTDDDERRAAMMQTSIQSPSDLARFDVWFTEKNDTVNGVKYVMFNRPTALIKFFATQPTPEDTIYGVLDPDFVFLHTIPASTLAKVDHHEPVSAFYSLGSKWVSWGKEICESHVAGNIGDCSTFGPRLRPLSQTIYEGGAPYFMSKSDWQELLPVWISVMPATHKFYAGIESDMYAYMISLVLLGMKQTLETNLMRTCMITKNVRMDDETVFVHYCQRYHVQETRGGPYNVNNASEFMRPGQYIEAVSRHTYSFSKYWMQARGSQDWILECESPLLVEPPKLSNIFFANLREPSLQRKDYAVLRALVPAINDALAAFKSKVCPSQGRKINLARSMILHESHKHTKHLLNSIIPAT
ncbi:Hydroxyproline O-arabinosyltransferase 3 [Hondaea fermentalgiana]|uniref:Hydroxyproline O-arabinosyltransferase 3 n=1 Tax=Hondaea fermentalgiana TaxID=2315210 RepID=A0A2R5GR73_9STRA|nr:Hydroxyproline O-arabinosyltransferase 3 [Hondaea fermentalgiana]|eukprot:GBG30384.1 Hydroxyproline O-arabinosyltransferase 3 [Hondaea fermentalgiana]